MEITYRVGDLRQLVKESSNEFKAKLGDGVESGNKTNNGKAYSDAKKRAKDYDGGLGEEVLEKKPKFEKVDYNGTTLDYEPENVSKEYKDRVKAQVKGYTSVAEMNNDIEKAGDFSDNENIYNGIKKNGQERHEDRKEECKKGLTGRERPAGYFDKDEMYESVKVIRFKKPFLSESQMISKIPDDFKKEGRVFVMEDKTGNKYRIEWNDNRANILEHENKAGLNEAVARMNALAGYKTNDTKTTSSTRVNENDEKFAAILGRMREINGKI